MQQDQATTAVLEYVQDAGNPLIAVVGPTASGKTGCSIQIAQSLAKHGKQVEIVNADSRQLYRLLDIGTAKITEAEMQGIQHHMIDVLDPTEEATAGWFQAEATDIIDQIRKRGNVPMLVGGSMLYISTIIDGLHMPPVVAEDVRKRIEAEYDVDQGATLYAKLEQQDSEAAERLHQNNKPRLIRAMEILECADEAHMRSERPVEDLYIFGLQWERETLVDRINARAAEMMRGGWIEEMQSLLDKGFSSEDPAMKSHGYREIIAHLESGGHEPIDKLTERIAAKTRQYAKRQMTWWRGDPRIQWVQMG